MFLDRPSYDPVSGGWLSKGPLVFQYKAARLTVPALSFTDFSSIPRWAPILVVLFNPSAGKDRYPAALHDYLYKVKWATRKRCDKAYKAAMKSEGVGRIKRNLLYAGVRAGGWTRGNW